MNNAQCLIDMESCGISTSNNLRQILMTCQDPVETIKTFQDANSIQLDSLKPVMKLLDLHGIRRVKYFETVIGCLSDQILIKIKSLGDNPTPSNVLKLELQLERCFKLYNVPKLRAIVLETLKQLPKVADRYLKLIVYDRDFYNDCAVSVKQQIWVKNISLFIEDINPVIDSYLEEKEKLLISSEKSTTNFFTCDTTKARRQWKQIGEIITMIGEYEKLYKILNSFIRERFIKSNNSHLCSLKMEILMAVHDINVDYAIKIDPCHDFAWCLDACVRDKHLDSQQSFKLKMLLDGSRKELNKIIGDIAMISRDPHIAHFICSMIIKILRDNTFSANYLPREHLTLHLLLKLLSLGMRATDILKGEFPLQLINVDVLTRFLPAFSVFIAEDVIAFELQKVPEEVADEFNTDLLSNDLYGTIVEFLHTDENCALLWIHYLIEILPTKRRILNRKTINRYCQFLPNTCNMIALKDPWLHLFINRLIQANPVDPLIADDLIAKNIISNLLITFINAHSNIKFHLLQLCAHLKASINEVLFENARNVLIKIYNKINLNSENDGVFNLFFVQEFNKHKITITTTNLEAVKSSAVIASVTATDLKTQAALQPKIT